MDALVSGLLKSGAPWGVLCGVLIVACITLWRRLTMLSDRVIELANAQVKVQAETRSALEGAQKELDRVTQRFQVPSQVPR